MAQDMTVSVNFLGMQRTVTRKDSINIPITGETTVKDTLEYVRNLYPELNLDDDMVLITVNQEKASLDRLLHADDSVSFLPHISGG